MSLDERIHRTLCELRKLGPAQHVHFDDALGVSIPASDGPQWVSLCVRVAEIAKTLGGRFIVRLSLGTAAELPTGLADLASIESIDLDAPPEVWYVADNDAPRELVGEHYRRDLPGSAPGFLQFVAAERSALERENGEAFAVGIYFDVRS